MRKGKVDLNTRAHLDWMGFVQPHGLVVSAPALVQAGAFLNRNDTEGQDLLNACVSEKDDDDAEPLIEDFESFARSVLGWGFRREYYTAIRDPSDAPDALAVTLPEYGETLHPDYAIKHRKPPEDGGPEWQLLVRTLDSSQRFDWELYRIVTKNRIFVWFSLDSIRHYQVQYLCKRLIPNG